MIKYVKTIFDLPSKKVYSTCADPKYLNYVSKLMGKRSDIISLGDISEQSGDRDQKVSLLIVSPDWPDLLKDFRNEFNDIYIMIIPEGEDWAYYELTKDLIEDIEFRDGGISYPSEAFYEILVSRNSFLFKDDGAYKVHASHYYSFFSDLIAANRDKINFVLSMLSDDQSRWIYKNLLEFNNTQAFNYYLERFFFNVQYMDYIRLGKGAVVFNGGVANAFEIPYFLAMTGGETTIHSFDPLDNSQLSDFTRRNIEHFPDNIHFHKFALMDHDGDIALNMDNGQATVKIDSTRSREQQLAGDKTFPCRKIDTVCDDLKLDRLDFIKLDLEGAEPQALNGALKSIKRFRPQLAVSIYHTPTHFWDLPVFLLGNLKDYLAFIGHYSFACWETILYLVPKEVLVDST